MSLSKGKERWIDCYTSSQKILLVGEGDFSFSACLARAFRTATNIVATSYLHEYWLVQKHWTSVPHLEELEKLGCMLLYGVDVYNMHRHPTLKKMRFDIIIFNFPHVGHYDYLCEHDLELIEMHRELVEAYFRSSSKMLKEGGEVHIRHRDDHPYDSWNVISLAVKAGLKLKEKVGFQKSDFPGYHNKRGGEIKTNKTFPILCAFTFKFVLDLPKHQPKINDEVHDHDNELSKSHLVGNDLAKKDRVDVNIVVLDEPLKRDGVDVDIIVSDAPPNKDGLDDVVLDDPLKKDGDDVVLDNPLKKDGVDVVLDDPLKKDGVDVVLDDPLKKDGVDVVVLDDLLKKDGVDVVVLDDPLKKDEVDIVVVLDDPIEKNGVDYVIFPNDPHKRDGDDNGVAVLDDPKNRLNDNIVLDDSLNRDRVNYVGVNLDVPLKIDGVDNDGGGGVPLKIDVVDELVGDVGGIDGIDGLAGDVDPLKINGIYDGLAGDVDLVKLNGVDDGPGGISLDTLKMDGGDDDDGIVVDSIKMDGGDFGLGAPSFDHLKVNEGDSDSSVVGPLKINAFDVGLGRLSTHPVKMDEGGDDGINVDPLITNGLDEGHGVSLDPLKIYGGDDGRLGDVALDALKIDGGGGGLDGIVLDTQKIVGGDGGHGGIDLDHLKMGGGDGVDPLNIEGGDSVMVFI